jgi:hypothetical protein
MARDFVGERVGLLRRLTVWGPWAVLVAARLLFTPTAMTDPARRSLSVLTMLAGLVGLVAWFVGRRWPRAWPWAALAAIIVAFWVAIVGAVRVGSGAPLEWFLLPYLWALAVVGVLFRGRVLAP